MIIIIASVEVKNDKGLYSLNKKSLIIFPVLWGVFRFRQSYILFAGKRLRPVTGRFSAEDSVEKVYRKMPNHQEIPDPLSLNKYTYCHNNPTFHTDPTGHFVLPFLAVTAITGVVAGAIAGGISSALQDKFSWKAVAKGAAIGGTIGLTGGAAGVQKVVETVDKTLKFGENDLVYGIYDDLSIIELQKTAGSKFLNSFIRPDGMSWIDFSKQMIDKTIADGNIIRFNLMPDMDKYMSFMGIGEYANSITIQELRYIYQNWERLSAGVRFYEKGAEVPPPWINWF